MGVQDKTQKALLPFPCKQRAAAWSRKGTPSAPRSTPPHCCKSPAWCPPPPPKYFPSAVGCNYNCPQLCCRIIPRICNWHRELHRPMSVYLQVNFYVRYHSPLIVQIRVVDAIHPPHKSPTAPGCCLRSQASPPVPDRHSLSAGHCILRRNRKRHRVISDYNIFVKNRFLLSRHIPAR